MSRRIEYTAGDFVGDHGLIFIEDVEPKVTPSGKKVRKARFLCSCGEAFSATFEDVKRSKSATTSCGCYRREVGIAKCKKNGELNAGEGNHNWRGGIKKHYLYATWRNMLQRCYNEKAKNFEYYGGRGIKVFEPWHDSVTFIEFCDEVLGERPEGYTLDRIDTNGGYCPTNVRWADAKTQIDNRRKRNAS